MSSPSSPQQHDPVFENRYTIRRKLGSGSVGTVYLAHDEVSARLVALKIIRTEQLVPRTSDTMQNEFRAIASLDHPGVAQAYDFGYTETGIPYYTREYIEGSPLPAGPPSNEPPRTFLRPILDLLEILDYVHAQGSLHLDIHAGNVVVSDDDRRGCVLIDFGLVRLPEKPVLLSGGSWSVMPPEMLEKAPLTHSTDLFLVGRLMH